MTINRVKALSTAVVLSALLVGCADPVVDKNQTTQTAKVGCYQDKVLAPDFTCNPVFAGHMTGLGIAKMNAGGDKGFQRTEAMGSARDDLARQVEIKVSNLLKKYKGTTGSGANGTFDKASSDVSTQLASQTLTGSKQVGSSWRHPDTNELYLMVGISTQDVADKLDDSVNSSFKNDDAMYQRYLADKANGELQTELEKAAE